MKIWYVDINYNYQHFSEMDVREGAKYYIVDIEHPLLKYRSDLNTIPKNDERVFHNFEEACNYAVLRLDTARNLHMAVVQKLDSDILHIGRLFNDSL
jgi:hypothetical protein